MNPQAFGARGAKKRAFRRRCSRYLASESCSCVGAVRACGVSKPPQHARVWAGTDRHTTSFPILFVDRNGLASSAAKDTGLAPLLARLRARSNVPCVMTRHADSSSAACLLNVLGLFLPAASSIHQARAPGRQMLPLHIVAQVTNSDSPIVIITTPQSRTSLLSLSPQTFWPSVHTSASG